MTRLIVILILILILLVLVLSDDNNTTSDSVTNTTTIIDNDNISDVIDENEKKLLALVEKATQEHGQISKQRAIALSNLGSNYYYEYF